MFFGAHSKFIFDQEKQLSCFMSKYLLTQPIMTFRLFAKFFGVYKNPLNSGSGKILKSDADKKFNDLFENLQNQFLNKIVSASIHEVLCQ